jgi:hypothetical protein
MSRWRRIITVLALIGAVVSATPAASGGTDGDRPVIGIESAGAERYRVFGTGWRWRTLDLTYGFVNYTSDLPQTTQRSIVASAFRRWADVSSLRFRRVADCGRPLGHSACRRPHIRIQFVRRSTFLVRPGLRVPWGGSAGFAFAPPSTGVQSATNTTPGDIQLNDFDTRWSTDAAPGSTPLITIALHEIGHALGLDHTQERRCPIFGSPGPTYPVMCSISVSLVDQLHADDIRGIQSLYGNWR